MSKNTSSNAFRRIDVDQFNEDNFKDEPEVGGAPGEGTAASAQLDIGPITSLIQSGQQAEALKTILAQAPMGASKAQEEKVQSSPSKTDNRERNEGENRTGNK